MKFPKDFIFRMKDPVTKAAFISEIQSPNPNDCENCGGAGTMHIFIATAGPFQSPPGAGKVGHWGMGQKKEGWWEGNTFGGVCPVCEGLGKKHTESREIPIPPEVSRQIEAIEERFENARLPYKDDAPA